MRNTLGLFVVATLATLLADAHRAEACGGCFVPPSEATVVTDHRMALSMSTEQTVLWDQIRYSGDPSEFAWVLPVRGGAKIEVANDEFFAALDASTQPIVFAPQNFGGPGCALSGCSSETATSADSSGAGGQVQVLSRSVVGPYEQVTLRATDDDALTAWLRKNAFTIPPSIEPTIAAYVQERFDFIALKLRPQCGERSMRPVRIVTPGADPTLPLRMVAAGVGARVGIILYVIGEGRYQPQNFPSALIDDSQLRWKRFENRSNYEEVSQEIMARENGRTWITEYADKPQIPLSGTGWQRPRPPTSVPFSRLPGFADTYFGLCKSYRASNPSPSFPSSSSSSSGGTTFTPCPQTDAGQSQSQPPPDAAAEAGPSNDAGNDDGGSTDPDAGSTSDAGDEVDSGSGQNQDPGQKEDGEDSEQQGSRPGSLFSECAYLDDLDVALKGMHRETVWVTRLRSVLPSTALSGGDLRLEPTVLADGRADTTPVSSLHWTPYYEDEDRDPSTDKTSCEGAHPRRRPFATWAVTIVSGIFGVAWLRRRRRRER